MTVAAQPGTWTVDTALSTAAFTVRNLLFKTVPGTFPIRSAAVTVGEDGKPRTLTATLDADGFSTGTPKRDIHIKGADFLDSAVHPDVTFASTSIAEAGAGEWRIEGTLTLRGRTSPVVLTAHSIGATGPDRAEISATGRIKRREAGITKGPALFIGEDVDIELTVVLRPAGPGGVQ
jgi:polyisoprenoid-binding protein YceI